MDWIARRHPELAILAHPSGDDGRLLEARYPGRVYRDSDSLGAWESASRSGFRAAISDESFHDSVMDASPAILVVEDVASGAGLQPLGSIRQQRPVRPVELALRQGNGWDWIRHIDLEAGSRVLVAARTATSDSVTDGLRSLGIEVASVLPVGHGIGLRYSDIERLEQVHGRLPWVFDAMDEARGDAESFDRPIHVLHRELVVSPAITRLVDALIPGR